MEVFAYLIPYGLEWLNLIVRWLHVITGIAWIGASFYFVWLDNSIRPPASGSELAKKGVSGELWAVHGGGFYNPQNTCWRPPNCRRSCTGSNGKRIPPGCRALRC